MLRVVAVKMFFVVFLLIILRSEREDGNHLHGDEKGNVQKRLQDDQRYLALSFEQIERPAKLLNYF